MIKNIIFSLILIFGFIGNYAYSTSMIPSGGFRDISDLMVNKTTPVSLVSKLNGKVNLVYFGFTGCGKTCPLALSALNLLYEEVNNNQLVVMFVNIDTNISFEDTYKYVTHFNDKFKVATGSQQQIDKVGERFFTLFWPDSNTTYQHTDYIALVNQDGQFETLYRPSELAELFEIVKKRLIKIK